MRDCVDYDDRGQDDLRNLVDETDQRAGYIYYKEYKEQ